MPRITASRRITPALNSIRSPGRTSLLGLAGAPLIFTRPPRIASTASARVLTRRAAHSHLSIRTGSRFIAHIVPDLRRRLALCGYEENDRSGGAGALWHWFRPPPRPRARSKVLRGSFTLVGSDGDYVTGKFGKAHLVDGKRNDKLSVHVRRLAKRTTYTFKLQTGSCGGAEVTGWTYRQLKTSRKGVGNSWARSKTFKVVKGTKYFVAVYAPGQPAGRVRAAELQGQVAPAQVARQARADAPGHDDDKPRGKSDDAPGQAEDKPRGKSDDAPGQAEDKQRGKSDDAPGHNKDKDKEEAAPLTPGRMPQVGARGGAAPGSPRISVGRVEPALQRGVPDERDLAVGVDPVAHAQLAHEPERVARAGAAAVRGERAGAGLDRPAAGVQRRERAALLLASACPAGPGPRGAADRRPRTTRLGGLGRTRLGPSPAGNGP